MPSGLLASQRSFLGHALLFALINSLFHSIFYIIYLNKDMNLIANKYIRAVLNFFKYGLITLVIAVFLNYSALQQEAKAFSHHGMFYDVGFGQKLFMCCKGKGAPTILMEASLGETSDKYTHVQEILANITKVCIYDRAGLGLSERPLDKDQIRGEHLNRGKEFTLERMIDDLRRLISSSSSDQVKSFILVGSQFGTLITRFYSQIYENEVSHLVLIDPLVENLFNFDDAILNAYFQDKLFKLNTMAFGCLSGANRILLMLGLVHPDYSDEFSLDVIVRQKHNLCNPRHVFSAIDEYKSLNESLTQMKLIWSIKKFPEKIETTIIKTKSNELNERQKEAWNKANNFLAQNLHSNAQLLNYDSISYNQLLTTKSQILVDLLKNQVQMTRLNKKDTDKLVVEVKSS